MLTRHTLATAGWLRLFVFLCCLATAGTARGQDPDLPGAPANVETLPAGTLVIPMDGVQTLDGSAFNLRAYGLVNELLAAGIPVKWAIRAGKAKDGVDFSATAQRVYPSSAPVTSVDFQGGPFLVHADLAAAAASVITAFGGSVAVYELTAATDVDVRYTLTVKPKVAVLDDGGNADIHEAVLLEAGFAAGRDYDVLNAVDVPALGGGSCYTMATEPHWAATAPTSDPQASSIRTFVESGGNFLGQCEGLQTYENNPTYGLFQTTAGIETTNDKKVGDLFGGADVSYSQFLGSLEVPGGSIIDWALAAGSAFQNAGHAHVQSSVSGKIQASLSKVVPGGTGSLVFYLGGHEYKNNDLASLNGRRMYLNAVLTPAARPVVCGLAFSADLRLEAAVDDPVAAAGEQATFTFTLVNDGPDLASGVQVEVDLPAGLSFTAATPGQGSYDAGAGRWTVGSLASGASATLALTTTVTASGSHVVTSEVVASDQDDPDSTPANGSTTEDDDASTSLLSVSADLRLAMIVDESAPSVGTTVTFTLTLANDGPDAVDGVSVDALLPAGLRFGSATPGQGSYDELTGVWTVGTLASGDVVTLTVDAQVDAFDPLTFPAEVAAMTGRDPDSTPANGSTTEDDDDAATVTPQSLGAGLCYLVADSGNLLTKVIRATGTEAVIGGTGVDRIESAAYWPGTHTIYAADANQLGTLDFAGGGGFTAIGGFGTADGAAGAVTLNDVDGLAFDPFTGILYGTHRREGSPNFDDLLFQIDPSTGAFVPDAFGAGVDYVVVATTAATGFPDVDDIAVSAWDGTLYGIANNGGFGDRLVAIDKTTGAVTDVGPLAQDDMEGLAFDAFGQLYGTTGSSGGAYSNSFFTVDQGTGAATYVAGLTGGGDYESVACLTDGVNTISGTVFFDADADGVYQAGTDTESPGVTVRLYRDVDADGQVTGSDLLVASQETAAGYVFTVAATGAFVLQVDAADLPGDATLTTDDVEAAVFAGFGGTDTGNDFGYTRYVDLHLTLTVDEPAPDQGADVVFTLTVGNDGPAGATGVAVTALLPAGLTYVGAAAGQGSYDGATGVWTVGDLADGAVATLAITATVDTPDPATLEGEVTAADQLDVDSTPANGSTTEDDDDAATVTPAGSSGGDDGGLESDGGLAQTLAQVLYERRLRAASGEAAPPPRFEGAPAAGKGSGVLDTRLGELMALVPVEGPAGSRPYVVSPTDLLPVTNADAVFAVDYLRETDGRRLGVLFATITPEGTLYEHTKVVCDRLRGAVLEDVRHVDVDGRPFVLSRLRHADGTLDQAVSFVVYRTDAGFVVDSRFRLDEYAAPAGSGEVYNVQVWSVSEAYTAELVGAVLRTLGGRAPVTFQNAAAPPRLPRVYVRTGHYREGRLVLDVYNAAGAPSLTFTGGTLSRAESGPREVFAVDVPLPVPAETPVVEVEVPVGLVFDAAFFVEAGGEGGRDQLYLADGAWSYTRDDGGAYVYGFDIRPPSGELGAAGKLAVARDPRLTGDVRTWAVLFRYLRPNAEPVDLRAYRYLEFSAWGEGQVRLLVEKASLGGSEAYGDVFKLTDEPTVHRLWFADLRRGDGTGGFTAEDVAALSFYVVGDQHRMQPFDLHVSGVRFGGSAGDRLAEVPEHFELQQNYPNPFNPKTTITFGLPEAGPVRLAVYDLLGRRLSVLADGPFEAGRHEVTFDARRLASGVYLYRLETPSGVLTRSMTLMR